MQRAPKNTGMGPRTVIQSIATTVIRIPTSDRTATNFLKKIVLLRLVTPLEIGAKSHMNWHCAPPLPKSNQQFTTSIDRTQSCLIPTTARTATKFLEQYRVTEIGHTNGKWSDILYDLTLCASASDVYSVVRDSDVYSVVSMSIRVGTQSSWKFSENEMKHHSNCNLWTWKILG